MSSSFDMTRRAALHFLSTAPALMGVAAASTGTAAAAPLKPSFAVTTPIHIHSVSLRVRDLAMMTGFYSQVIGLDVQKSDASESTLGKDGVPLLRLISKPDDKPDDQVSAGLYHTAFLMPDRKELGRWLITAYVNGIPFTGFADHAVSEALYLNDPEGNGIEVYADRPPESWSWKADGRIVMGTEELNMDDLLQGLPRDGNLPYAAPSGFRIGHVHMRVGDTAAAEDFYVKATGLDLTANAGRGARFFSGGRYHHHIGANVWQSRGAGARPEGMSGLEDAAFSVHPELMDGLRGRLKEYGTDIAEKGDVLEAIDPWGTKIRYIPQA